MVVYIVALTVGVAKSLDIVTVKSEDEVSNLLGVVYLVTFDITIWVVESFDIVTVTGVVCCCSSKIQYHLMEFE